MAIIISHHDAPLPLPNGQTLRPGARTNVDRWDTVKDHDLVKGWLKAGLLTEDKGEIAEKAPSSKKKVN